MKKADFRTFYRDANAVECLSEREKMLIGLTVATILTILFVPALYAAWFRVKRASEPGPAATAGHAPQPGPATVAVPTH